MIPTPNAWSSTTTGNTNAENNTAKATTGDTLSVTSINRGDVMRLIRNIPDTKVSTRRVPRYTSDGLCVSLAEATPL